MKIPRTRTLPYIVGEFIVTVVMKSDAWGPFWTIIGGLCAGLLIAVLS